MNQAKTSLFFSSNTPKEVQEEIKRRFGDQVIKQHEKYLGLPSLVGRNKRNTFNNIKEKLKKKLAWWKEKMLSKASKEGLIKAVAQVILTYTISYYKILSSLCVDLTGMVRKFWWGKRKEENVGKFRPQLIELTSFKPKLLIRFLMNKTCQNKQISLSCQNHAVEKNK